MLQQKQAADLDLSTEVATRLNLVDRETPAVVPDAHTAHTRHTDEDIPRLTKVCLSGMTCSQENHQYIFCYLMYMYCLCV